MEEKLRMGNFALVDLDGKWTCDVCGELSDENFILINNDRMCEHCLLKFSKFINIINQFKV